MLSNASSQLKVKIMVHKSCLESLWGSLTYRPSVIFFVARSARDNSFHNAEF